MKKGEDSRPIKAVYYNGREKALKRTAGKHPRSMTKAAFDHMQTDEYGASVVEVFDNKVLHAVITRTPRKVEAIYKRDPVKYQE